MIKEEDIKEISHYIILAANSLRWNDYNKIEELTDEVGKQIRLYLPKNEKKMRRYVENAYSNASFIYNTGHSFLFYERHDRQPTELKFGFNIDDLYWIRKSKKKYLTEEEADIILERLNEDTSKWVCNSRCDRFWKSEKSAYRFHVPVTFHGENFFYCDKSTSNCIYKNINKNP